MVLGYRAIVRWPNLWYNKITLPRQHTYEEVAEVVDTDDDNGIEADAAPPKLIVRSRNSRDTRITPIQRSLSKQWVEHLKQYGGCLYSFDGRLEEVMAKVLDLPSPYDAMELSRLMVRQGLVCRMAFNKTIYGTWLPNRKAETAYNRLYSETPPVKPTARPQGATRPKGAFMPEIVKPKARKKPA
jgi:hypothetical protein